MLMLKAINPKNQSKVNKAIEWNDKHEFANLSRENADLESDHTMYKYWNKRAELCYNKYLEILLDLPKNQIKAIERFISPK